MKKYIRLLIIPAALWTLGMGLVFLGGGCKGSGPDAEPSVAPISEQADTDAVATTAPLSTVPPNRTATPEPTEAPTPTPIAVNTDTSTVTYLVNREYPLPENFVPEGLTTPDVLFPFSDTTIDKAKMTPDAGAALALLFDAAYDEAGLTLYGVSAYRSYARQYTIYATNLATRGVAHTNRYSAAPGRSEHQTGLAIDISCASEGFGLETTFADTPEGIWVAKNAHRFGFILRYPKDKEHITGYNYEPWHIRYVGTELAGYLYETGLTLDEYYGVPSTLSAEYLETTPLIDTTAESYLSIYRQYH
ncbi:MAG: D-alanyl-D-alanine carboxypeptidase family protein [Lachnospiraceae bacterium]|nr:D-alanyl-D-alanine carboxypeptidase family protein [Lachnospiraceae bacterium]MBE6680396.1 D-alanyl-D-alanine carboxypeptidase family protein [Oscillospiraceae bacterium]